MSQRPRNNAGYEQSRGAAGRGAGKTGAAAGGRYGHQQAGAPQQPHAYPQQPQPQQQAQGHKGAPPPPGYGRTSPYSSPAPFSPSQTPQHVYPTPHHPELLPVPFFSLSPQELYRRLSDPKNPIPSYLRFRSSELKDFMKEKPPPFSLRNPSGLTMISPQLGFPDQAFSGPGDSEERLDRVAVSYGYAVPQIPQQYGTYLQTASHCHELIALLRDRMAQELNIAAAISSSSSSSTSSSGSLVWTNTSSSASSSPPFISSSISSSSSSSSNLSSSIASSILIDGRGYIGGNGRLMQLQMIQYERSVMELQSLDFNDSLGSHIVPVDADEAHFGQWLRNLGDLSVPLERLPHHHTVPYLPYHPSKIPDLVHRLCVLEIPLPRLTWYVAGVFYGPSKPKPKLAMICDWTRDLVELVKVALSEQSGKSEAAALLRRASLILQEHVMQGLFHMPDLLASFDALLRSLREKGAWSSVCSIIDLLLRIAVALREQRARLQVYGATKAISMGSNAQQLYTLASMSVRLHQLFLSERDPSHPEGRVAATDKELAADPFRACAIKGALTVRQASSSALSVYEARSATLRVYHAFCEQSYAHLRAEQIQLLNYHSSHAPPYQLAMLASQLFRASLEGDLKLLFDWLLHSLNAGSPMLFLFRSAFAASLLQHHKAASGADVVPPILTYFHALVSLRASAADHKTHGPGEVALDSCEACRFWWSIGGIFGELARRGLVLPKQYMRYLISHKLAAIPGHQQLLLHFPFPPSATAADLTERRTLLRRGSLTCPDLKNVLRTLDLAALVAFCRERKGSLSRHAAGEITRHVTQETQRLLAHQRPATLLFAGMPPGAAISDRFVFHFAFIFFEFADVSSLVELLQLIVSQPKTQASPSFAPSLLSLLSSFWHLTHTGSLPPVPCTDDDNQQDQQQHRTLQRQVLQDTSLIPELSVQLLSEDLSPAGLRQFLVESAEEAEQRVSAGLICMILTGNSSASSFEFRKFFLLLLEDERGALSPSKSIPRELLISLLRQLLVAPLAEYPHFDGVLQLARESLEPVTHLWPFLVGCCTSQHDGVWQLALEVAASHPYHTKLLSLSAQEIQTFITSNFFKLHKSRQKSLIHCLRTRQVQADSPTAMRTSLNVARTIVKSLTEWTFSLDSIEAKVTLEQDMTVLIQQALRSLAVSGRASSSAGSISMLSAYLIQLDSRTPRGVLEEVLGLLASDTQFNQALSVLLGSPDENEPHSLHVAFLSVAIACLQAKSFDGETKRHLTRTLRDQLNHFHKLYSTTPWSYAPSGKSSGCSIPHLLRIQRNLLLRLKLLAALIPDARKEAEELRALAVALFRTLSIPLVHVHSLQAHPPHFFASWILAMLHSLLDDLYRDPNKQRPGFPPRLRNDLTNEFMKIFAESPVLVPITDLIYIFLPHMLRAAHIKTQETPLRSQSPLSVLAPYYVARSPRRQLTYSTIFQR